MSQVNPVDFFEAIHLSPYDLPTRVMMDSMGKVDVECYKGSTTVDEFHGWD